jgi:hypothetical protein
MQMTIKLTGNAAYQLVVQRGIAIVTSQSKKQWELGDLAAEVAKAYSEDSLGQFCEDISFDGTASTLRRYRSVCFAFPKTGGRPRFFASAQILATHPDRLAIVERNPDISKAEARELMFKLLGEASQEGDEDDQDEEDNEPTPAPARVKPAKARGARRIANRVPKPEWLRNIEGWIADQVASVNAVTNEITKVMEKCTPEQRKLLATLEPTLLLEAFQEGERKAAKFVDWVDTPLEKAADALMQQGGGRVVVTPAPPKGTRRPSAPET